MSEKPTFLERVYPGGEVPIGWKLLVQARMEQPAVAATDLALIVGVSAQTIRIWQKKAAYQRYENWALKGEIERIVPNGGQESTPAERVKEMVSDYAEDCFLRLQDILEGTSNQKLAVAISQDLLNRAGIAPVQEVKHTGAGRAMVMTPEVLQMFARRALEAGVDPIIDVEVVEEDRQSA